MLYSFSVSDIETSTNWLVWETKEPSNIPYKTVEFSPYGGKGLY